MDDLTPGIGDTVEWGEPVYSYPAGMEKKLIAPAHRGVIVDVYKNGVIKVQPSHQKRCMNFRAGEFTILSKAD